MLMKILIYLLREIHFSNKLIQSIEDINIIVKTKSFHNFSLKKQLFILQN